MALGAAYAIIWLDAHIGSEDNCRILKKEFEAGLAEAAAVPPLPHDPIDDLICAFREYSAPIEFAATQEDALKLIEKNLSLKKVIFITSGRLGKEILPRIMDNNFKIESFYIFCGAMTLHRDWAIEYIDHGIDLQMFDFETDLLVRLGRDMGQILTEEGKLLLNSNNPATAVKYFEYASALVEKAIECDQAKSPPRSHPPSTAHRKVLKDLIAQAKEAEQAMQ